MSELHEVTCDKCGKKQKMINGRDGEYTDFKKWLLPNGWDWHGKKDLCPSCVKKLENIKNKFLK